MEGINLTPCGLLDSGNICMTSAQVQDVSFTPKYMLRGQRKHIPCGLMVL